MLADLYIGRKDVPKAIVSCRKVLKAAPRDLPVLTKLAFLLKQSGKKAEAADAFRNVAAAYRRNGNTEQAIETLRHLVELEPDNLEAHTELAEVAAAGNKTALAATAFLKAAEIARRNGMNDRWVNLAERAHLLDPTNKVGCIAAAEVYLARNQARESVALLEPISKAAPDDTVVLKLLCRAYLDSGEYAKAEPVCLRLFQAQPVTVDLTEQLIQGLLNNGQTARALAVLEGIKEQMYRLAGKRSEFLALAEQIYHADEDNLEVLELLPPLYNEFNREGPLRLALTRLFNLYLANERYDKAAETLESILDVDPYGAAHSDRLLNLEGHIDAIWYNDIAGRISIPGVGHGITPGRVEMDEQPEPGTSASLDDLVIEAEMYHRYHLTAKLQEILKKIDRLYPGAYLDNQSLTELNEMAGFQPTPFEPPPAENQSSQETAPAQLPVEELGRISSITAVIHRQGTIERVLDTATGQLGRLLDASRCWIAAGPPDSTAITAEYVAPNIAPSDSPATLGICAFLTNSADLGPEGWAIDNVSPVKQLEPIAPQLSQTGITALVAVPLMDKEQKAGMLLVEQCQTPRRWTDGEKMLARAVASQVTIAINSTRLRRLVRSLAGTDITTGLLPRTAYIDCLLAEARRAEEQSRPLSVCLMEPTGAGGLSRKFGEADIKSYIHQVGNTVSSKVRQNDIAIRYGPCTIALCLPDTPLARSRVLIDKLQTQLREAQIGSEPSPAFSAVVSDMFLGPRFDAVDAVTEVINRLENSMEVLRREPEARTLLAGFVG